MERITDLVLDLANAGNLGNAPAGAGVPSRAGRSDTLIR
jgi:hypothetical protein